MAAGNDQEGASMLVTNTLHLVQGNPRVFSHRPLFALDLISTERKLNLIQQPSQCLLKPNIAAHFHGPILALGRVDSERMQSSVSQLADPAVVWQQSAAHLQPNHDLFGRRKEQQQRAAFVQRPDLRSWFKHSLCGRSGPGIQASWWQIAQRDAAGHHVCNRGAFPHEKLPHLSLWKDHRLLLHSVVANHAHDGRGLRVRPLEAISVDKRVPSQTP
mmetsp:Transcript_55873/g.130923  ORF Transcript_55873/g.130923 Transcript_55873/m.130923 type:complete len:216 (+) Transcript_55873:1024-1671(+)|eukprot:2217712-Rhodomonas_salina.2